jgi:hypothetical protein
MVSRAATVNSSRAMESSKRMEEADRVNMAARREVMEEGRNAVVRDTMATMADLAEEMLLREAGESHPHGSYFRYTC